MTSPAVPGDLLAHLQACQDDALDQIGRLRAQITELSERLHQAEQLLERLELTQKTLLGIAPPAATGDPEPLPPAYQQILDVFARTDGGLHAKDLCHALNTGDQPRHIEGMRSKLKRLVGRNILTEPEPGMFTMKRQAS
ncbi:MAG: hypothetical protein JWL97_4387 [Gemmatimonadales bacterium]|nr:hypothetical protein [Gemmatimonadales bacterium]